MEGTSTSVHSLAFMKRVLCVFLFLWSLTALAACGWQANNDGKIHLTLWYWNRVLDDTLIAQVSKQFPNIVLTSVKVDHYKDKLLTAMAGHSGVPDIVAINSDIASYYPDEDQFVDLNTVGAKEIASEYLPWKWRLGTTPSGRQIAIPIDTGPTALFYRADIFQKAGLPTDPEQVSAAFKTWDAYLQAGPKIAAATAGKSFLTDDLYTLFEMQLAASKDQYFAPDGKYIGDQQHIKQMWDLSSAAMKTQGVIGKAINDWNQAANNGRIASFVGPVWNKAILEDSAPDTKGKWRMARAPADGNNGGSFLAVTTYSDHAKAAFEVIKWLENPQNQVIAYNDIQTFPSAIAALNDPSLGQPEAFFGGQNTTPIFAASAQNVPLFFSGPMDATVDNTLYDELLNVEFSGKDSEQAWKDAQQAIERALLR